MGLIRRRDFLKGLGAASVIGVSGFTPRTAFAGGFGCEAVDRILLVIHAAGGMNATAALPPTPSSSAYEGYLSRYPSLHIPGSRQLQFPSVFAGTAGTGLHPALGEILSLTSGPTALAGIGAALFNRVGFRRATDGADITSRSHEDATQQYGAGDPVPGVVPGGTGWVGRFARDYCNSPYNYNLINLGGVRRYSKATDVPVLTGGGLASFEHSVDDADFSGTSYIGFNHYRRDILRNINGAVPLMHPAQEMFSSTQTSADEAANRLGSVRTQYEALGKSVYPVSYSIKTTSSGARYAELHTHQPFMDAAALCYSWQETGTRVITLSHGNFDTHGFEGGYENFDPDAPYSALAQGTVTDADYGSVTAYLGPQANLLQQLANGIVGFFRDLDRMRNHPDPAKRRNVPEVVAIVMPEIGRSWQNTVGTDHGTAGGCWVIGNGVRNLVHTNYDLAMFAAPPPTIQWLRAGLDPRVILSDVTGRFLGRNPADIFPGAFPIDGYVAGGSIFA